MATADSEGIGQRTFGIMSIVFAGFQAFFHITTAIVPDEAPWAVFILLVVVALVFAVLGIVFAIVGLTRRGGSSDSMSMAGLVANTVILVVAIMGWVVWTIGEYS